MLILCISTSFLFYPGITFFSHSTLRLHEGFTNDTVKTENLPLHVVNCFHFFLPAPLLYGRALEFVVFDLVSSNAAETLIYLLLTPARLLLSGSWIWLRSSRWFSSASQVSLVRSKASRSSPAWITLLSKMPRSLPVWVRNCRLLQGKLGKKRFRSR